MVYFKTQPFDSLRAGSFFWFVADENGVFYSPYNDFLKEKQKTEKQRAKILVFLMESGFSEQALHLDFEVKRGDVLEFIDLVAFVKAEPYLAVDFLPQGASENAIKTAKETLISKAKAINAKRVCLFTGKERDCFMIMA